MLVPGSKSIIKYVLIEKSGDLVDASPHLEDLAAYREADGSFGNRRVEQWEYRVNRYGGHDIIVLGEIGH